MCSAYSPPCGDPVLTRLLEVLLLVHNATEIGVTPPLGCQNGPSVLHQQACPNHAYRRFSFFCRAVS
ncbi:unnamed protein product [Lota lota]